MVPETRQEHVAGEHQPHVSCWPCDKGVFRARSAANVILANTMNINKFIHRVNLIQILGAMLMF